MLRSSRKRNRKLKINQDQENIKKNYYTITQTISEAQKEKDTLVVESNRLGRELADRNKEKDEMAKEKKMLVNEETDIHRKLVNQVNVNEHLEEKK